MATIQDVARRAHVGAATVSRVLNKNGYVKEETRERVLQAIKELNYTPNEMARNLYRRKSGIVAIIMPEISYPYFGEFANAAEIVLFEHGYQSMICTTGKAENYEVHYLDLLKQQRVDGIITGVHTLETQKYNEIDGPIVALDRLLNDRIPCVAVNHSKGGRLAAEELIAAGCRNVLQCTGTGMVTTPSNARHEVFANIMKDRGISCHSYKMRWNAFDYSYYNETAEELIDKYPDVDGIFATDVTVLSLLKAAQAKGRRYPEDIKAVAYDGTYVSSLIYPSLTTIVQPIFELASTCVDVLMKMIQGQEIKEKNIQLEVQLRRGESTRRI